MSLLCDILRDKYGAPDDETLTPEHKFYFFTWEADLIQLDRLSLQYYFYLSSRNIVSSLGSPDQQIKNNIVTLPRKNENKLIDSHIKVNKHSNVYSMRESSHSGSSKA